MNLGSMIAAIARRFGKDSVSVPDSAKALDIPHGLPARNVVRRRPPAPWVPNIKGTRIENGRRIAR